jgi:hypothetical protein
MGLFKHMNSLICCYCLAELRSRKPPQRCPKCKSELPVQYVYDYDSNPPFFVQMFGWSAAGKTTFISALTLMLVRMSEVWPRYTWSAATDGSHRKVREMNAYFAKGIMPQITSLGPQEIYIMMLRHMELFGGRSLVLRDCAGEVFDTMEIPLEQAPYLLNTPTTLMLISLPDLPYAGGRTIEMLLTNYLNTLMKHGVDFDRERRKLVVVLTKADLIPNLPIGLRYYLLADSLWAAMYKKEPVEHVDTATVLDATAMYDYLKTMKQVSDKIRDWIQQDASGKAFVRLAESKNLEMRFSLISSTGGAVSEGNTAPVTLSPKRVLDPLFWALAFQNDDILEDGRVASSSSKGISTNGDSQSPDEYKMRISDPQSPDERKIRILFLAANPTDTTRLRLDQEMREIERVLHQAEFRDRFDIRQHWAVRVSDLQELLLRYKPDIVHFSGHGSALSEIVLEDASGNSHPVSVRALSSLFSVLKDNIKCVVLNACYSEQQAQAIAQSIECVVGMSKAIGDESAIGFATAFYQALGFGRDVGTAFELGCIQIDLEGLSEGNTPKLLTAARPSKGIVFVK